MKKHDNSSAISGLGTTLLQIAFIVLKLCKVINWSWWWVLAPTWIGIAIAIISILIIVILVKKQDREYRKLMKKVMDE